MNKASFCKTNHGKTNTLNTHYLRKVAYIATFLVYLYTCNVSLIKGKDEEKGGLWACFWGV